MAMNVEAEIRELKRRVSELEGSFGFLTKQVQGVHKDLLRFEEKTDKKLREHDGRFDKVEGRLDRVETEIRGLRTDLPKIVGDAMREVNREKTVRKR
jgi:predicted RNase H-like nuclease (RuvC/YqgF family)